MAHVLCVYSKENRRRIRAWTFHSGRREKGRVKGSVRNQPETLYGCLLAWREVVQYKHGDYSTSRSRSEAKSHLVDLYRCSCRILRDPRFRVLSRWFQVVAWKEHRFPAWKYNCPFCRIAGTCITALVGRNVSLVTGKPDCACAEIPAAGL